MKIEFNMSATGEWEMALAEMAQDFYTSVADYAFNNQEVVAGVCAALILGGSAVLLRNKRRSWMRRTRRMLGLKRGKQMNRAEFRQLQKVRMANAIVSGIEDAVAIGEVERSYANSTYRALAFWFKSTDFLPQKLPKSQRLSQQEYEVVMKLLFNKIPADIPGPKPGEVDNVYVYSKGNPNPSVRKFGDKVRRRA